jgi:hypothetical protein
MSLKKEILKHQIPLKHLEDETLIKLFIELNFFREYDRNLRLEIAKELAFRKKLFLLTKRF